MIFTAFKKLSPIEEAKLKKIMDDPVLWAKAFIQARNPATMKTGPWIARKYQVEMMHDDSLRKVYRMGRRLGKTDTMCVEGLHKAANNKGFRILYVTPYENQVDLIFARMKEIIADSPLIKTLVTRITNSPYKIEFSNGSQIRGFTTGAASGNGAASVIS